MMMIIIIFFIFIIIFMKAGDKTGMRVMKDNECLRVGWP